MAAAEEKRKCPLRPREHGTESPLQTRPLFVAVELVEAARFWGGQVFIPSKTKLSHHPRVDVSCPLLLLRLEFIFACGKLRIAR